MTEIFADNIAQFRDINVVWFKRDLRIRDNKVLCDASARGQILPLYIFQILIHKIWKSAFPSDRDQKNNIMYKMMPQ